MQANYIDRHVFDTKYKNGGETGVNVACESSDPHSGMFRRDKSCGTWRCLLSSAGLLDLDYEGTTKAYNCENNQQDALYRLIYYSKSALHVSGDVFAHHQEHLTVFTVSGSVHPSCCRLVSRMSWNFRSVVGLATGYGLDGPGIDSRWGRNFLHLSRPALGPTQPPLKWVPGLSRGKKRPGHDADPSPASSAVVMK